MTAGSNCPACGGDRLESFHRQESVPAHSCLLMQDREQALGYPRGSIELALCHGCGFITNRRFDPALSHYSDSYEETQGFSPRFRRFASELAATWVDSYGLRDRQLVEIGCGKGEFLAEMCEVGGNHGVGIDPAYVPERGDYPAASRLIFRRELYGEQHLDLPADALVCRHTLEHISEVGSFLDLVRGAVDRQSRDVVVLFEVPDVLRVLREGAFWDVYYEHCSYFTAGSLARLFRSRGFELSDLYLAFDDQYVILEATSSESPAGSSRDLEDDLADIEAAVGEFRSSYPTEVSRWRQELAAAAALGRRTVVWGAGSKAVAYLNTLGPEAGIELAVDINPYKQGMFLAGTGTPVVGPEYLKHYEPDRVVMMNPIYREEISRQLGDMGLAPVLSSV